MSLASRPLAALALLAALSACASQVPQQPTASLQSDTGLDRMERLTLTANRCWFRSGDPLFTRYSLAPELSSFSGRPRFLVVPRNRPEERPLLVVEGRTGSREVDSYGPLLQSEAASRIRQDLQRWAAGAESCSA